MGNFTPQKKKNKNNKCARSSLVLAWAIQALGGLGFFGVYLEVRVGSDESCYVIIGRATLLTTQSGALE